MSNGNTDDDEGFGAAFDEGIKAAVDAGNARRRFEELVKKLAADIGARTDGELTIFLDTTTIVKAADYTNRFLTNIGLEPAPHRIEAFGLFVATINGAFTSEHPKRRERICTITFGPGTYPLQFQWEDQSRMCHDDADSRGALASVIKDPRVGRVFNELRESHPRRPQERERAESWLNNLYGLFVQRHQRTMVIAPNDAIGLDISATRRIVQRLESAGHVTAMRDFDGVFTITLTDAGIDHMKRAKQTTVEEHRRLFESVKRQGASRIHWLDFDANLKNELMSLLEVRKQLQADAPSTPGAVIPPTLKERLDKVNAAIESINRVREDVAVELDEPQAE